MIFKNLQPRLDEAIQLADQTKKDQEVKLMYQELLCKWSMNPAFEYLFEKKVEFSTRFDEYRYVLIIHPKK